MKDLLLVTITYFLFFFAYQSRYKNFSLEKIKNEKN